MATDKKETTVGAFGKDKLFGNRIDEVFEKNVPFVMLGARIADPAFPTEIGTARLSKMLVQKIDPTTWAPVGQPIEAGTLASSIADKIEAQVPGDFPAVVELREVDSKKFGTKALVLQFVGNVGEDSNAAMLGAYGLDAGDVGRSLDKLRPVGDRLPSDF